MSDASTLLTDASEYLYRELQKRARTREEHEDGSISLMLLKLLREGWASGPNIFDLACGLAVGCVHARYMHKRAERAAFERLELLRAIPDYDYSTEAKPGRDPADGRRHFGNQFGCRKKPPQRISSLAQIDAMKRAAGGDYFGA